MSESDVPSPQRSKSPSSTSNISGPILESEDRSKVIRQARDFLKKDDVRNEDREKQVAFLKTKGLSQKEIEGLIEEIQQPKPPVDTIASNSPSDEENAVKSEITATEDPCLSSPPIITYPEFLTKQSPKLPALLTINGLLTILYSTSFLTASLYGTFEYIVSPMLDRLANCRHELLSTTLSNLDRLSQKLESVVSEIPSTVYSHINIDDSASAKDLDDDDPAELFHRDIGTQTSPLSIQTQDSDYQSVQSPLAHQAAGICSLHRQLHDLIDILTNETKHDLNLGCMMADLRNNFNTIAYSPFSSNQFERVYRSNGRIEGYTGNNHAVSMNRDSEEVTQLKKEIKGMKGLLLSARTFPGIKPVIYQSNDKSFTT